MTLAQIGQFVRENQAVLALLGLAFVVRMPEDPPPPLDKVPFIAWHWHWFREGMLTFVSFRAPASTQATTYRQETAAGSVTQTSESKTDATVAK